jgi:hypothetical protein
MRSWTQEAGAGSYVPLALLLVRVSRVHDFSSISRVLVISFPIRLPFSLAGFLGGGLVFFPVVRWRDPFSDLVCP